jgi:exodeoxyribonuclease VII large subunit
MSDNVPVFTVSEISGAIRQAVEGQFGHIRVRGEISQFKAAGSGHLYLRLKDDSSVLDAVCWRGTAQRLATRPEDGLEVIATGRLTTYPGRSSYQLVIEALEPAGEGALLKQLEERRKRLAAEGLFDASRKKPLPFLPEVIGIVTSPTGSVIRDILHRLEARFPRHVVIWPVPVQGEGAARQIAAAIDGFNAADGSAFPRPDLLIVARGGGSLEDLMAFNEEIVVRAAAASAIPLISGVGHETDTTLIDHAADLRAPTPTAAAEMSVPVRAELAARLAERGGRAAAAARRFSTERRARLEGLARGLTHPRRLLEQQGQRLDDCRERLDNAARGAIRAKRALLAECSARLRHPGQSLRESRTRLDGLAERLHDAAARLVEPRKQKLKASAALLESYSYHNVLGRGFALLRDSARKPIHAAADTRPGQEVEIEFRDGSRTAVMGGTGKPDKKPPRDGKTGRQGQLF